jgi:hypothetical protein
MTGCPPRERNAMQRTARGEGKPQPVDILVMPDVDPSRLGNRPGFYGEGNAIGKELKADEPKAPKYKGKPSEGVPKVLINEIHRCLRVGEDGGRSNRRRPSVQKAV